MIKRNDKVIRYQRHAEVRMRQRGISREQVGLTIRQCDTIRAARRPGALRFEKAISRQRRLAVIADEESTVLWVVSAFWM